LKGGWQMAVFFMFGKYTPDALKEISASRTKQAVDVINNLGGEVNAMHILMGKYDLLFCVTLPGIEEAIKASVELTRLTGITFNTCPAIAVEIFDRLAKK
jgi:uncharacterized protein with GYD domain